MIPTVSILSAKLLKEFGYSEECFGVYEIRENGYSYSCLIPKDRNNINENGIEQYSAPYIRDALSWVTDKFNVHFYYGEFKSPCNFFYVKQDSKILFEILHCEEIWKGYDELLQKFLTLEKTKNNDILKSF